MPRSGSTSTGGFSSGGGFSDPWGSFDAPLYKPPTESTQDDDTGATPGGLSADVTSPQHLVEAMAANTQEASNFLDGMSKAVFGTDKRTFLQGLFGADNGSLLGGTPIGDAARFIGGVPGGIGDTLKNAGDIAGGAFEHVQLPGNEDLVERYDKLPPDLKAEYDEQIAAHPDIASHIRYQALIADADRKQLENPKLNPYEDIPRGSLADTLGYMLGPWLGTPQRAIERVIAGAGKASGLNRLEELEAIDAGGVPTGILGTGFLAGGAKLSENEQVALDNWRSGVWSQDEALTYLAATAGGLSHDKALEIAGMIATDPGVVGSVGAVGLAKIGLTGASLVALEARAGARLALRAAGTSGKINVLGRAAESQRVNDLVRLIGKQYAGLEGTTLGRAAKVTRYIIDPLHNVGQHRVAKEAMVDVLGEAAPRAVIEAHGDMVYVNAVRYAAEATPDGALVDMMAEDLGTYSANLGRGVLLEAHQADMLAQKLGQELIQSVPGDIIDDLIKHAPKDIGAYIKQKAIGVRQLVWDDAGMQNLAERMESMYAVKTAREFLADIAGWSDETRAFWHELTYGRATKGLLEAIAASTPEYTGKVPLKRMILLNVGTVTDIGAKGILERVKGAQGVGAKVAEVRAAQGKYRELSYISLDPANLQRSVSRFVDWLQKRVDDGVIPHQVTEGELAKMPQPLRDLDSQMHGAWTLGFAPEDDLRWGLEFDLEGGYRAATVPWPDHVANLIPGGYRPAFTQVYNIAGQPIPNAIVRAAMKPIDHMVAASNTIKAQVTSAQITEAARVRFAAKAAGVGMTEAEAKIVFEEVIQAAGLRKTSARGLLESNMWELVAHAVPKRMYQQGFGRRELMALVLDAYEGDMRFVGLTQKLTGRAKTMLQPLGGNMIGHVSEYLYPKLKFQVNALFQTQERIEPIVLNSQRGVEVAFGNKMSAADRQANAILERMAETSVTRISDIDQWEFSAQALAGGLGEAALKRSVPRQLWNTLTDVQGAKRVNLIRTFRHRLGLELKDVMERVQPGLWDDVKTEFTRQAGYVMSDDEVAVKWVAGQMFGNDVKVGRLLKPGAANVDFDAAINVANWHLPATIGELKGLDLDFMAKRMAFPLEHGRYTQNANDVRAAIAAGKLTLEDVTDALVWHGMHPDYVRRVENALSFSWGTFWGQVRSRFNLSPDELNHVQMMMVRSAEVRGMTPVDFLSQVFSPYVQAGSEATISELEKAVSILRVPFGADAPRYGVEQLMDQMADVFMAHLDPSGREALFAAFEKELPGDIQAAYSAGKPGAGRQLQKVLEDMRGGWTPSGEQYSSKGRVVADDEMAALRARGQGLLGRAADEAAPVDVAGNTSRAIDDLYQRTMPEPWGGATFSAREGTYTGKPTWLHHGTLGANERGVTGFGMRPGANWVDDVETAKQYALGNRGLLYRALPEDVAGTEKAVGWREGGRVKPERMEVSRDGGKTWEPVSGADQPGAWATGASGVEDSLDVPITQMQDAGFFRATVERFVAAHEDELARPGRYLGLFRDEKKGMVSLDVSVVTTSRRDTEALLAAQPHQVGGSYDFETGSGLFAPRTAEQARTEAVAERAQAASRFADAVLDRVAELPSAFKLSAERRLEWIEAGATEETVGIVSALVEARARAMNVPVGDLVKNVRVVASDTVPATGAAQFQIGDDGVLHLSKKGAWAEDVVDIPIEQAPKGDILARYPQQGPPGIGLGYDAAAPEEFTVLYRDQTGRPVGYLRLVRSSDGQAITNVMIFVEPGFRRQGIATQLYDWVQKIGYDLRGASGKTVTAEGRAFTRSYWGRKMEPTVRYQSAVEAVWGPERWNLDDELRAFAQQRLDEADVLQASLDMPAPRVLREAGLGEMSKMQGYDLPDGRRLFIPGGTDGEFSYWDMWRLQAQGIDPGVIPDSIRKPLYDKLFRTQTRSLERDPLDAGNRMLFALMSPGTNLTDSAALFGRVRFTSMDDVDSLAAIADQVLATGGSTSDIGYAVQKAVGLADLKPAAGANIRSAVSRASNVQFGNAALFARRFRERPDWFLKLPDESLMEYTERLVNVTPGAGYKVGNFSVMLGNPATHPVGTVDTHVMQMLGLGKRSLGAGKSSPGAKVIQYRVKGGGVNPMVPDHLRNMPWEPEKVLVYGGGYEDADRLLRKAWQESGVTSMDVGGHQWYRWDPQRAKLEPHQYVYPGTSRLPRQPLDEANRAYATLSEAGFTGRGSVRPFRPSEAVLYQPGPGAPRGYTVREASETIIGLTKTADPSTAIHETWHGILEPSLTETQRATLEAAGAVGEEGARLFEAYLGTGRAPTSELRRVFAAAKRLLKQVYAKIKGSPIEAKLAPEVKATFDEMLTTVRDPDIERAVQQFGKWSKSAMADGLLTRGQNPYSELLGRVAGIDTQYAAPYNATHQLMVNQVMNAMRLKEQDAFRLQYFARSRTWFERSINHPMLGIYPSSYMWGKIAPEIIRFVAKEPFGLRTGAMAYTFADVQKAIAIQREFDPEFDALIEKLGHSQAVWFLGYLLPSVAWDIGAAAPSWMRDIAQQGLDNQSRVDRGLEPEPIDLIGPLRKVSDYVSPFRSVFQTERALEEVLAPPKVTDTSTAIQPAPTGPMKAVELGPTLEQQMRALEQVLANH